MNGAARAVVPPDMRPQHALLAAFVTLVVATLASSSAADHPARAKKVGEAPIPCNADKLVSGEHKPCGGGCCTKDQRCGKDQRCH